MFYFRKKTMGFVIALAIGVLASAGCGDSAEDSVVEKPVVEEPAGDDDTTAKELVLDFTTSIDGGKQISGLGIQRETGLAAFVTDFEEVILFDLPSQSVQTSFNVGWNDGLSQGETEAIAFDTEESVAVLYPEKHAIRRYSLTGELLTSLTIDTDVELAGGMTIDADAAEAIVVSKTAPPALLTVSMADGIVKSTTPLVGIESPLVDGLSPDVDGDAFRRRVFD